MIRDDETGVTPLRGQRAGEEWEAKPARGYSWEPFGEGNTAGRVHGAHSEREIGRGPGRSWPRCSRSGSAGSCAVPGVPQHVWAWARAEAVTERMFDYLASLSFEEMVTPRLAATRSPVDLWKSTDAHAARLRQSLGLDPRGYAALRRDLGLSQRAAEESLGRLSDAGAAIVARRRELESGPG